MTHFEILITLLVSILTVIGMVAVGVRWIYKEGAAGEQLRQALATNTRATEELSISFKAYTVKIADQLTDHEKRLTRLETTTEMQRGRGA